MELKNTFTKVVDTLKATVADVKDTASETLHRVTAEVEQKKRDLVGNTMSTDAKASSMVNQAKQTVQADIDAMKRDDRNKTSA
jgi:hypothetical protein